MNYLRVLHHSSQWIIDLMSHSSSKSSKGHHFFRLDHQFLALFSSCNIPAQGYDLDLCFSIHHSSIYLYRRNVPRFIGIINFQISNITLLKAFLHRFGITFNIIFRCPLCDRSTLYVLEAFMSAQLSIFFVCIQYASLIINNDKARICSFNKNFIFIFTCLQ